VHGALAGLGRPVEPVAVSEHKTPAEIRRSVTPEALVSFLDGKSYKTLRRHLGTHGMTPETYRARFGLPADYPMTAANYAAHRSELAKAAGLGASRRKPRLVGSEAA
jgi:predicted transcriptional regulator